MIELTPVMRFALLLVRRCDTGDWELPGGHVDPGESASDAAVRETAEESGITVDITGLAGIYTNPGHAFIEIAGVRFDTSSEADPHPAKGTGPRWRPLFVDPAGFMARQPLRY